MCSTSIPLWADVFSIKVFGLFMTFNSLRVNLFMKTSNFYCGCIKRSNVIKIHFRAIFNRKNVSFKLG